VTGAAEDAREDILGRLRAALGPSREAPAARPSAQGAGAARYRRHGGRSVEQRRATFTDRLEDYRAEVVSCGAEVSQIRGAVREVLTGLAVTSLVAPSRVASAWLTIGEATEAEETVGPRVVVDHAGLVAADLAEIDAVVTGCALGIAESGVIVLDGDPWSGRRLISLVPDVHLCVVTLDQVVDLPPEAVERLDPRAPQTWIAGPSATSDIELERVEGVHGPRTLIVLLAG